MATICYHHVNAAIGGAKRLGSDPFELLTRAGINPKLQGNSLSRVGDTQMAKLVQLVWQVTNDEFMGFTPAPCQYGAFALTARSIRRYETLREALQAGIDFFNLFSDGIETQLIETDTDVRFRAKFNAPEYDAQYYYHEFWLVIWHRFASWLIGTKIPLLQANLSFEKPAHVQELNYLFPCPHRYNSQHHELVIDRQYLAMQTIRTESELEDFLRHSPIDIMTIPGADNTLANRITQSILAKNSSGNVYLPTQEQLAKDLHFSPITLHRKLLQEGSSYQQIKDNIRRDIAVAKLTNERMTVKQVSELVGFSEPRSFTRAFKQWTGLSPREYCKFI